MRIVKRWHFIGDVVNEVLVDSILENAVRVQDNPLVVSLKKLKPLLLHLKWIEGVVDVLGCDRGQELQQVRVLPPLSRLLAILHEAKVYFCSIFSSFGHV